MTIFDKRLSLICICVSCFFSIAKADEPVDVEGQPLAANVDRLLTALEDIGAPILRDDAKKLREMVAEQNAADLQRMLDKHSLLTVTINPEERVSVSQGTASATLQQNEYAAFVIKIVNQSKATPKLNVTSPQAGAVYAGTSMFSLKRQQQTELGKDQNETNRKDRFLDVELYRKEPLKLSLSGLEVEYGILLVFSSEAGKRDATLAFDIGEGTKDLGFRHQTSILFDVAPANKVEIRVDDPSQPKTVNAIAKLEIRDSQGRVFPLQPKRMAPDFFFQPHIYRRNGEDVALAAGGYTVRCSRGPEYRVLEKKFVVENDIESTWKLNLERWVNPIDYGFYSGDHHIHAAGCSHYTSPTEGVTPEQMFRQVSGEGLNVGCVLTWGPCFDFQRRFFKPVASDFGNSETILKYDLEISGFGSQALGHVCLLNLNDQTYPGSEGSSDKGWPTWTTPVMKWAKEQGGYTGYAHSASGLAIDPKNATGRLLEQLDTDGDSLLSKKEVDDALLPFALKEIDSNSDERLSKSELVAAHEKAATELPNHAIPEMNGVGAMEICVSTVAGVCDFISAMDTSRTQEWNTWYHLLNCGFPLKVSGETDFPCMSSRRVGKGRVYVQLGGEQLPGEKIDFAKWCAALAAGKSYVSDGYAHALEFSVDDIAPGFGDVQLDNAGRVSINAKVAFAPETPHTVAQGTQDKLEDKSKVGDTVELHHLREDDWIEGGQRKIEIVVNGKVVAEKNIAADGEEHNLRFEVDISESSWVALRHFPQLHTNPVNVIVDSKPIRASGRSAQWCIDMTQLVWKNRQHSIAADEREEASAAFDVAIKRLKEIKAESK